jgi:hypothetical protein
MLWHKNVVVKKLNVSQYYIDVVVGGGEWRLTGIYGEPSWDQKDQTWEAPRFLKNRSMNSLPSMALGDFCWRILTHIYTTNI